MKKLILLTMAFAALGLFYSGEALATVCKSSTGTCKTVFGSCPSGYTSVTTCTQTTNVPTTGSGSVISCTSGSPLGTIATTRGDASTGTPAVWTESGTVTCDYFPDTNNNGVPDCAKTNPPTCVPNDPRQVELSVTYTMAGSCIDDPNAGLGQCKWSDLQNPGKRGGTTSTNASQAICTPSSVSNPFVPYDVLTYQAFCGLGVTVKGHLKYVGSTPPPSSWVFNLGGVTPDGYAGPFVLVLGGFETDKKGNVINCSTDFPDQTSGGGLPAGKVLYYTEKYGPNTNCTGPRIDASDGQRRMCQDHTFYNPKYYPFGAGPDKTLGTPDDTYGTATNPPCAPTKTPSGTVTYRFGILPTDVADITAAPLYDNQWMPNSTLNLTCTNSGTIPTTILNSDNFAASSFQLTPPSQSIVAYVQGVPDDVSPATSANVIYDINNNPTGLKVYFNDCTGSGNGLDQVICRHFSNSQTVNLTIQGDKASGLGFIGDALNIKINNVTNCPL